MRYELPYRIFVRVLTVPRCPRCLRLLSSAATAAAQLSVGVVGGERERLSYTSTQLCAPLVVLGILQRREVRL